MARRDALLRLHKSLVGRRDELRKRLGGELKDLRNFKSGDTGDSADLAFDAGSDEVASTLAELESRELAKIEIALNKLKQGTYGVCEGCQRKIPVARLNALPFSATCIECQREMELYGTWGGPGGNANWEKVSDHPTPLEDQREVNISEIEIDMSSR
ncbi:MAG: TraR/DksA family transcriptional regulator [Planctomycetes bacterium]|nr:TraR/DksA family transcriptional regulator [Planctomycetota bacterium]